MLLRVLIYLCCICYNGASYKILGVFHNPSKSHFYLGDTLLKALALRGHHVTFLTPYPVNTPLSNYKIVEIPDLQPSKDAIIRKIRTAVNGSIIEKFYSIQENFQIINHLFLNHPKVQNLLHSNETFDLVIFDWVFNDIFLGIADHFKASSIVFSSFGASSLTNKITSNPAPASYVPNIIPTASDEMSFWTRALNLFGHAVFEFHEFFSEAKETSALREYFPSAPSIKVLLNNVSLVFLNSHFTTETPRPYVPNMIQIGGFHINEPRALKTDLKRFMDEAPNGVLYCSFGSLVKSSEFNQDIVDIFIKTFSKIPLRVLWKYEGEPIENLPANIKIDKWFPQTDILGHPKMKVFVSHNGMLSVSEALYSGVPIIGIPFFGDQDHNLAHAVSRGLAIRMHFHNITEKAFIETIMEMLYNPKYRRNAKERSKLFRDQPIKPLNKAVYWVEYVLRHRGAHHLKVHALKLNLVQYFMLDVLLMSFGVILILKITCKFLISKTYEIAKYLRKRKAD